MRSRKSTLQDSRICRVFSDLEHLIVLQPYRARLAQGGVLPYDLHAWGERVHEEQMDDVDGGVARREDDASSSAEGDPSFERGSELASNGYLTLSRSPEEDRVGTTAPLGCGFSDPESSSQTFGLDILVCVRSVVRSWGGAGGRVPSPKEKRKRELEEWLEDEKDPATL